MVNMTNYEEYMLLYADGELSKEDEQALLAFVQQHPELQAELDAYTATILQPDTTLVYDGKEALMKDEPAKGAIWLGSWKTYAAAASVLLFVVLFAMNRSGKKGTEPTIVKKETITAPIIDPTPIPEIKEEVQPIKEVHSTKPVNAIAVETSLPDRQAKRNKLQPKPVKEQPIIEEAEEKPITEIAKVKQVNEPKQIENKPVVAVETKPEPKLEKIIEEPIDEAPTEVLHKKRNRFIASVLGKKPELLNGLETAVNEKMIVAKNVKDELKDTDVTFKIGKKELFTVRL